MYEYLIENDAQREVVTVKRNGEQLCVLSYADPLVILTHLDGDPEGELYKYVKPVRDCSRAEILSGYLGYPLH